MVLVSRSEEKETMEKINGFGFQKYFTKPYLVSPKKIIDTRSKTKTLGYIQAIDQEGLLAEFLTVMQNSGTPEQVARLFILGDREEDVWAGNALKRMASRDPTYTNSEIITILVNRQGTPQKTRANCIVRDLNEAYNIIISYRRKK